MAGGVHQDGVEAAPDIELLTSGDEAGRRSWRSGPGGVLALVLVVLVVAAGAVGLVQELRKDPSWPSDCGRDGHADWCAEPSEAMTDEGLAAVALAHCPALAGLSREEVLPQPLALIGPPDVETLALTSGSPADGTEDALLGQPGKLSWISRHVGGDDDGQVRLSCPQSTRSTAGLRLDPDQYRSTVAAVTSDRRRIDFGQVADDMVSAAGGHEPGGVSFGFLSCDTSTLPLMRLPASRTFLCAVEVYSSIGRGSYHATYRVTDHPPYFALADEPTA